SFTEMHLTCLSINHRTAPVEIRERLWYSDAETRAFLPALKEAGADECVLVSTCNRTELYYVTRQEMPRVPADPAAWTAGRPGEASIRSRLTEFKNASGVVLDPHVIPMPNSPAIRHLFNVAGGIDSMVIGDVQILNQIKTAFQLAQDLETTGIFTNRL